MSALSMWKESQMNSNKTNASTWVYSTVSSGVTLVLLGVLVMLGVLVRGLWEQNKNL